MWKHCQLAVPCRGQIDEIQAMRQKCQIALHCLAFQQRCHGHRWQTKKLQYFFLIVKKILLSDLVINGWVRELFDEITGSKKSCGTVPLINSRLKRPNCHYLNL